MDQAPAEPDHSPATGLGAATNHGSVDSITPENALGGQSPGLAAGAQPSQKRLHFESDAVSETYVEREDVEEGNTSGTAAYFMLAEYLQLLRGRGEVDQPTLEALIHRVSKQELEKKEVTTMNKMLADFEGLSDIKFGIKVFNALRPSVPAAGGGGGGAAAAAGGGKGGGAADDIAAGTDATADREDDEEPKKKKKKVTNVVQEIHWSRV